MTKEPIFPPGARRFPTPFAPRPSRRIYPLFLPFSGCPRRCLFCAQDAQTGFAPGPVKERLAQAENDLEDMRRRDLARRGQGPEARASGRGARPSARRPPRSVPRQDAPPELAFYGGTFTALPDNAFDACLDLVRSLTKRGLISGARCSTRPDAALHGPGGENAPGGSSLPSTAGRKRLEAMRTAGFTLVEVGVQSFSDAALAACGRGYDGRAALAALALVREAGLAGGVQLMPGLPGQSQDDAARDIALCREAAPCCVRLYPCLVLKNTGLEDLWRRGGYSPLTLEAALRFLADACLSLEGDGVPVIRMGLAPQAGLGDAVLAGPHLPDLGGAARALALHIHLRQRLAEWRHALPEGGTFARPLLYAPLSLQGLFWGHGASLVGPYAALGLGPDRLRFEERPDFMLCGEDSGGE